MSVFTKRPLGFLERVYKFVGGQTGPKAVDLDSPVVLVHDLARSSEKVGPGVAGGWFQRVLTNVHPGLDIQNSNFDPYAALEDDFGVDIEELWVWLYEWSAFRTAGAGDITAGTIFIVYPTIVQAFPAPLPKPISLYSAVFQPDTDQLRENTQHQGTTVPVVVPPGSLLHFTTISTAAVTFQAGYLMWAGPRGVQPFIMSGRA